MNRTKMKLTSFGKTKLSIRRRFRCYLGLINRHCISWLKNLSYKYLYLYRHSETVYGFLIRFQNVRSPRQIAAIAIIAKPFIVYSNELNKAVVSTFPIGEVYKVPIHSGEVDGVTWLKENGWSRIDIQRLLPGIPIYRLVEVYGEFM